MHPIKLNLKASTLSWIKTVKSSHVYFMFGSYLKFENNYSLSANPHLPQFRLKSIR